MRILNQFVRAPATIAGIILLVASAIALPFSSADEPKKKTAAKDKEIILPKDTITQKQWLSASTKPLRRGEIDQIIDSELKSAGVQPARPSNSEEFMRRVYLDLTGRLPSPADVVKFVADKNANKRAELIDRLLASEEYASHWAGYWRNVITSRVTDPISLSLAQPFESWMAQQIKKNNGWGKVARKMITSTGTIQRGAKAKESDGAAFLYLSRRGNDAIVERTAETSRIFLGIQLQCAQCHDHPFDVWKREQFHQMAAYLVRLRERPVRDGRRLIGLKLVSLPFREHRMKDLEKPTKSTVMYPRFLDGNALRGFRISDAKRRTSLADSITSKNNPWFGAAYVNRVWGKLLGQSFYEPIDDLGPKREAVMPKLIVRLAGAFRGSDYDTKQLVRAIMNSKAYQRKIRLGKAVNQHQMFAGVYPNRLQGDALWNSLVCVLGRLEFGRFGGRGGGLYRSFRGLKFQFMREFNYDPSARPEEVEGTITQALLMMNSPVLNRRIKAAGANLLGRVLRAYPKNEAALNVLYLRVYSRGPSASEMKKCLAYVTKVDNRAEAFEDILWVLLNSAEFQTKK